MPIQTEMRDAGRILYITFTDVWDTADLREAVVTIQNRLTSANGPIHLVVDARATYQVPLGTLSVIPMRRPSLGSTMIKECIFVGGTSVSRSIAQAAFKLCNMNRVAFVETEDQALDRLHSSARHGTRV